MHSVDRGKIARRLSDYRPPGLPPLQVCLQVNISGETEQIRRFPGRIAAAGPRGGGDAPPAVAGTHGNTGAHHRLAGQQRAAFASLRQALAQIQALAPGVDTLSMGMSDDLEAAIAEGATMVRVGTDIFGSRNR